MTNSPLRETAMLAGAIRRFSRMFLIEGVVLVVLGLLAALAPMLATVAVTILIGWLFVIAGVVGFAASLSVRDQPGLWWAMLSAVVTIVAGGLLLGWPVAGALSLTVVLIAFFVLEGIVTIMFAIEHRRESTGRWAIMLASGIVTLVLAGIIFLGLPGTAEWALGLIVGIDLIFGGVALIAIGMAARNAA
jgi:uncharacterized membrane protein HdeD (DUF308 family)